MEKISVIIITKNEEKRIRSCLESVKGLGEIVIVDSGSADKTLPIAREYTDRIFNREFDDFSSQKNFAMSKCMNDWILSLDADEEVSKELKERLLSLEPKGKVGYRIKRQTYIFNRLMRYGGHSKDAPLRFFNRKKGRFIQPIHEFFKAEGSVGFIKEPIIHYSTEDLNEYVKKLNCYTDLEVKFLSEQNADFSFTSFLLKPIIRFFQRYLLQRGFLDGQEGFIFYVLSGVYDFLKWIKYWEKLKRNK